MSRCWANFAVVLPQLDTDIPPA